jgi:hypothetical protein
MPLGSHDYITPKSLKAGDILFKHASASPISKKIKDGQRHHYPVAAERLRDAPPPKPLGNALDEGRAFVLRQARIAPGVEEAIDITHVAVAVGPDDVLEFDEGGASNQQIVFRSGHGFVRGSMSLPSRAGKKYEVFRCTYEELWTRAIDKASLVWDLTHTNPAAKGIQDRTPLTASYGLRKMAVTALSEVPEVKKPAAGLSKVPGIGRVVKKVQPKGPDVSLDYFEKTLDDWLKAADKANSWHLGRANTNIQFFCSNFVLFCYLWAAHEWQQGGAIPGLNFVLGKKASIAPVELYVLLKGGGRRFFRYAGTLTNT